MTAATPRPATTNDRVNAVKNVNDGVRGVLGVAGDMFSDRPGFIAGDGGGWPLADAVRSVSQYNCRQWARADKSGFSALVNAGNAALCNPYLSTIGMAPADGEFSPPFVGGQCETVYNIPLWTRQVDGSEGVVTNLSLMGPIVSITKTNIAEFTDRFVATNEAGGTASADINFLSFGAQPRTGFYDPVGTPNDCGSPPVNYRPPNSTTGGPDDSGGIEIDIPGIGPITVNVNPNDEGNPVVCYEEIDLCIEIPIGQGDGVTAAPGADPGPPEEGTPGSTGEGGEDEGEAPEGRELWALKIDITSFPPRASEYAPGVYRGVCYVYVGDENGLDHDPAGAMLRDGQLVLAEKEGLTKYRVTANIGYNLTVTPYWRTPRKEA